MVVLLAESEGALANYDATVANYRETTLTAFQQVEDNLAATLLNERNEVDILRRRMDASVLLIKGLGGGWDVSKLPQISSMR